MLLDRGAKTFLHLYRATSEAPMAYRHTETDRHAYRNK